MAKYLGNAMLLKIYTAPATYGTIGGSSSHTLSITNEQVDVSDKDSSRWKELLAAGDRSVTISMSGFVSDNANFDLLEDAVVSDTITAFQIIYGNNKTITGNFHVDSLEYTGERNTGQAFSCTLTNSGTPTFA